MAFDPILPDQPGSAGRPGNPGRPPVRPTNPNVPAGRPAKSNVPARRPAGVPRPSGSGRRPPSHPAGERRNRQDLINRRQSPQGRRKPAASGTYQPKYASGSRRRPRKNGPGLPALLLIALMVLGSLALILMGIHMASSGGETAKNGISETTLPESTLSELPYVITEAKFTVTGDLLPHKTIYSQGSAVYKDQQDYNFDPIFKYLKGYTDAADYAIANLETSLYGPERAYSGNPNFNTPDQIVDGAKNAGFDMLLTANNHCNDTGLEGVLRTVKVIREKGLKALGTNLSSDERKYQIENINGIRVGMLCYTYEDSQDPNIVTFNYNPLPRESSDLVCSFPKFTNAKSREPFYTKLSLEIAEMKEQGADAIVLFVHWGEEYHLEASADQRALAQKFCDLGVDLIVGGHPHVVEPVELLTSTRDPGHKTVCLYSLGNAFSNQRREEMTSQKSGHTEDGMLFQFTFQKYSDNRVYLSSVDVIPTWVNKFQNAEEKREYNILPLEKEKQDQWQSLFALDAVTAQLAAESYSRTMAIVAGGLEASNAWLSQQLPNREVPAETSVPTAAE